MTNGATCPKGTPDAGKQGYVIVVDWTNYLSKKSTEVSGDPGSLKFGNGQMITMAFLPATASDPKPPAATITNLITAVQSGATTPTTAPSATPTTAPTGAPTVAPTTAPATTPTTAPTP
jgi:hypothetical protein